MRTKKQSNKTYKSLLTALALLALLGSTTAYLTWTFKDTTNNVGRVGTFEVVFENEDTAIDLVDAEPISYNKAMETVTPYTFSIDNKSDTEVYYELYITDYTGDVPMESVHIVLNDVSASKTLSNAVLVDEDTNIQSNASLRLDANTSNDFELFAWLDASYNYEGTPSCSFKLKVVSQQTVIEHEVHLETIKVKPLGQTDYLVPKEETKEERKEREQEACELQGLTEEQCGEDFEDMASKTQDEINSAYCDCYTYRYVKFLDEGTTGYQLQTSTVMKADAITNPDWASSWDGLYVEEYKLNTNSICTVRAYVPTEVSGVPVVAVGKVFSGALYDEATYNTYEMVTGMMGEGVERVGEHWNSNNSKFEWEILPESTICVAQNAYYNTPKIDRVRFNNALTTIMDNAFKKTGLTSVALHKTNVTYIGLNAFSDNTALTTVELPRTLQVLEQNAFANDTALTSVTFNPIENDLFIGQDVFTNTGVKEINIPSNGGSVITGTYLIDSVFGSQVESITLPGIKLNYNSMKAGIAKYSGALKNVNITGGLVVPGEAFFFCNNLEDVQLANSIRYIGAAAFYGTTNLTDITLPTNLSQIGDTAFQDSGITSVVIPSNVKNYSSGSTSNGGILAYDSTDKTYLDQLGTINNPYPTSYAMTTGVYNAMFQGIGEAAFKNCKDLTSVEIKDNPNLTTFGQNAFANCTKLKTVKLNEGLETLPVNAFAGCTSIESINLPSTLTYINTSSLSGVGNTAPNGNVTIKNDSVLTLGDIVRATKGNSNDVTFSTSASDTTGVITYNGITITVN